MDGLLLEIKHGPRVRGGGRGGGRCRVEGAIPFLLIHPCILTLTLTLYQSIDLSIYGFITWLMASGVWLASASASASVSASGVVVLV